MPTGIVGVEIANATRVVADASACPQCAKSGHDADARYCKNCGGPLG